MTEGMKKCTKCGQNKQLEEYHKRVCSPDGHTSLCKKCRNESQQKYNKAISEKRVKYLLEGKTEGPLVKQCCRCQQEKVLDCFNKKSASLDGRVSICKECHNEKQKAWAKTISGRKSIRTTWKNRSDTGAVKRWRAMNLYGLSEEQIDLLFKEKSCELCGRDFSDKVRSCVDHDHETGIVRGLLCLRCNSMLGYLRDAPLLFKKVVAYLEGERKYSIVPVRPDRLSHYSLWLEKRRETRVG